MLDFCLQSLFREYGWSFIRHVVVPHPLKTAKAVLRSSRRDFSGDMMATSDEDPGQTLGGPRSIVGVGFCLKPMDPPCLSGRSNHDCHYLEHLLHVGTREIPECCRQCAIRKIGLAALKTGAAFYVMTSAKDILHDLFLPGLNENRFTSGVFVLCRYSLRPFAVGPDILTSAGSFLTFLGPRFDVEAEGERGFGDRQVAGVQLLAQGYQGFGVAWGAELAEMDIEPAVG